MGTYVITGKNHEDWLRSREGGIGSSEVATVLGVNPYETPYQLWLRKTGQVKSEEKENFLMKAGHYLEDAISHFCADEADLTIIKSSASEFVVVDKDKPFLRVSPDRYAWEKGVMHSPANRVIIECKSTQKPVDPDNISQYWFCQVAYQLGVTGLERSYLAWLIQGREFGYKVINFDPEFFAFVKEEVERFWIDCVIGGREPALISVADVIIKYPKHEEGKKLLASDSLVDTWNELKSANEEIKRLESTKRELEDSFKTAMLDAESLVIPATADTPERTLATWKATKSSTKFDVESFREAEPDLYHKYCKEVQGGRRFSIK